MPMREKPWLHDFPLIPCYSYEENLSKLGITSPDAWYYLQSFPPGLILKKGKFCWSSSEAPRKDTSFFFDEEHEQWAGSLGWSISAHRVSDGEFLMWNLEVSVLKTSVLTDSKLVLYSQKIIFSWHALPTPPLPLLKRGHVHTLQTVPPTYSPRILNNEVSSSCADCIVTDPAQPWHAENT